MNVAYTFNHYYLEPTLISIFSLLQARKDNRPITVYLLVEEDLNREQLSPAFEMAEHFDHCRIVMIYPQKDFPRLFCSDETSCAPSEGIQVSFFRLYLPKVLPKEERCLFLDSDLVVRKDLSELYDTDLDGACFAGVTDRLCLEEDQLVKMRRLGIRDGWYINSGVMPMNLARLREKGLDDRLLAHASETAYRYLDQDVINFVCPKEIRILPKRYNVFSVDIPEHYDVLRGVIPDCMLEENDFQDPAIVHFTGPEKPWFAEIPMKRYWTEAEKAYRAWREQE